jgi:hypothetical protein
MIRQRFFRTASDSVYEQARLTLDAAWGHPTADGKAITCIDPAAIAPRDAQGRIVLAVREEFCTYSVAVDLLPQLLASGAVEEIDEATYLAAMPKPKL